MFEESVSTIPSIWASMNSWFTPTVLFVLLNVMIGTIAFTSTLANQNHHHHHHHQRQQHDSQNQQQKLGRSPSVLQRLKSINFSIHRSHEQQSLHSSHFKQGSDSESHFNLEPAQYIFSLPNQEKQSQYFFEPTTGERSEVNASSFQSNLDSSSDPESHFKFEQTQQSQAFEMQSQYIFSQQNMEKQGSFNEIPREERSNSFFEQNPHIRSREEAKSFVFQETHEEKIQEMEEKLQENAGNEEVNGLDEVYSQLNERHVSRSRSETKPASGEVPENIPTRMRKSVSLKSRGKLSDVAGEEDIVEDRRPATVRERRSKVADVDEEVDAKADDFINKFKQQLKLQRLDSILRGKEMVGRGTGK